ncbi:hypothetical protein ACFSUO_14950 [Lentibacillus juripiscarius]|uniref:Uncharacterized protein n=1 Tax=Lentibacillus juripiscarius TaxID=257446 RepID=A0ABW5V9B7_9BACI
MHLETREQDDQAKDLRELLNEVEGTNEEGDSRRTEESGEIGESAREKVDILDLPPRREVRTGNHKGIRLKMSRASLRLLTVIIVLLVLLGGAFYLWGEELLELIQHM